MINDVKYEVNAGFFNAINKDRTYSAEDMNKPYGKLISNGVFATPRGEPSTYLQVFAAGDGMNIIVSTGYALIGDKWFENSSDMMITLTPNSEVLTRIDSIIAQVDKTQSERRGCIVYRKGTASSNPIHPSLNNEDDIAEFRLADIVISPSCVEITQDLITDCRGSDECPWVTSLIYQVDTSTLYAQWNAAYKKYYEDQEAEFDAFFTEFKEMMSNFLSQEEENFTNAFEQMKQAYAKDFEQWFETLTTILDGDTAGNLFNLINLKSDKKKSWNIVINPSEWTNTVPYTQQTIQIEGIERTDEVNLYPIWSDDYETRQKEKEEYNKISMLQASNNAITIICDEERPQRAINARIEVIY